MNAMAHKDLKSEAEILLQRALIYSRLMKKPTLSYFIKMSLVELSEPSDETELQKSVIAK